MRKYISRACRCLAFLAGVIAIYFLLDYCISDDTRSMSRITFHDFYEQSDIDIAFIGTSHAMYSIDATGMSKTLGKKVFNLSTAAQDVRGSYYVFKELISRYNPEIVFFEISYSRLVKNRADATYVYSITDYMNMFNSSMYLLDTYKSKDYINSFFRLRRNLDPLKLPEATDIMKVIDKKKADDYNSYQDKIYLGLGEWKYTGSLGAVSGTSVNLNSEELDDFKVTDIRDANWGYYQKIIDICKEKGIKPVFYISPCSEFYIMELDCFEDIGKLVKEKITSMGAVLLDMNLIKAEYCYFDNDDYVNLDHLNSAAGESMSAFFAQYIANPEGDYFYNELSERYPKDYRIKYAGYDRYYILSDGSKTRKLDKAKKDGKVSKYYVEISPVAYHDVPVDIRLTEVVKNESGKWTEKKTIKGKRLSDSKAKFKLSFDEFETYYKIQFFEPGTDTLLFEAVQRFRKN